MSQTINRIINKIKEKKVTLAFAESVTCGLIAHKLGNVKGASDFFMGSIVCYNPDVKTGLLSVPPQLIKKYSAESAPVTKALVKGLSELLDADFYGAVTGLATADPGSRHPAGTIFICIYDGKKYTSAKKRFTGTPLTIRKKAFMEMMGLINRLLKQ